VLQPPELRAQLRAQAGQMAALYNAAR
jgi:hypothetical protein